MYKKNLNIFTYDYPYIGNDSKFIIDEIQEVEEVDDNLADIEL